MRKTKFHNKLSPTQTMRALNQFASAINSATDPEHKTALLQVAWRFAVAEARKNDKFPHVKFMDALEERTGIRMGSHV